MPVAARDAYFPTPAPGAGHSQSPEASAGNKGGFLVRFGSDFSPSSVLALNNVSRNNSAGRQQHRVIGKGFMALRVKLNWHPDVNFLDGIFPSWQRGTFHTNYSSSYLELITRSHACMQRHCLARRAWRLWLGSLPGPLILTDPDTGPGGR